MVCAVGRTVPAIFQYMEGQGEALQREERRQSGKEIVGDEEAAQDGIGNDVRPEQSR